MRFDSCWRPKLKYFQVFLLENTYLSGGGGAQRSYIRTVAIPHVVPFHGSHCEARVAPASIHTDARRGGGARDWVQLWLAFGSKTPTHICNGQSSLKCATLFGVKGALGAVEGEGTPLFCVR